MAATLSPVAFEKKNIVPVILCGGSGTRLWPASRNDLPKQFLPLLDDRSLLQNTLRRALRVSGADASSVVVVTLCGMEDILRRQLAEIDEAATAHILCEPSARNTAAAIALAANYVAKTFGEDAVMWVLPSDHHIGRESALAVSFQNAIHAARQGRLVTFGIKPTRADTGYGYIRTGKNDDADAALDVQKFVEKPNLETAERYVAEGCYLWNSGMFVFTAMAVLNQFRLHAPAILSGVQKSVERSAQRPDDALYNVIQELPFDKAIMETAGNAAVIPCDPAWSDVGSWESYWDISHKDGNGNAIEGRAVAHNTEGCLVRAKDRLIALSGVKDLVIIETEDALLVSGKANPDFKDLVEALKRSGAPEISTPEPAAAAQPWSMTKPLGNEDPLRAREIELKPGQSKAFAADGSDFFLYTVLEGAADITAGGVLHTLKAYQSLNVEGSSGHTVTNHGSGSLRLIEVRRRQQSVFFGAGANARKVA
jgi:mannose-1-phosphate guanylyltransferase/mannose-6-phosphate isomerase